MPLPLNIQIMDVANYIRDHNVLQVTSVFIKEQSTNNFHQEGLFSENIFGQIGTPERLIRFGHINLRTSLLHPLIYNNLIKLKALYGEILSGKTYAVFNEQTKDLDRAEQGENGAATGYKFFIDILPNIVFEKNNSVTRNDRILMIERYRKQLIIQQCLVLPAGIRDMTEDAGRLETDSINKPYLSLLNYSFALPLAGPVSDIFDSVRFAMQKKIGEIYDYLFDMVEGKQGFFQRKFGTRSLALGTRNVISPAIMAAKSPNDPAYLKVDEIKIPLFQCAKMFQPLVIYHLKMTFFGDVFTQSADQVGLIDTKTLNIVYQPVDEDVKTAFISSEGIEKLITRYRDREMRYDPVLIYNENNKPFYLYLVYDTGDSISILRSVSHFAKSLEALGKSFDKTKIRPITYAELLYIATYAATIDKCATVTRYPVAYVSSDVPCRVHLITSNPARTVDFVDIEGVKVGYKFPEYPIIHNSFIDSTIIHPSLLNGLTADFDGNCVLGTSYVRILFDADWLDGVADGDYSISGQDGAHVFNNINTNKHKLKENIYVVDIQIQDFPCIGSFKLDKNGAKVYTINGGLCMVHSYNGTDNAATFEPISSITVEDECETTRCMLDSREIVVSNNASLAVFDHTTGLITRATPADAVDNHLYVPILKADDADYGTAGAYREGWLLGVSLFGYPTDETEYKVVCHRTATITCIYKKQSVVVPTRTQLHGKSDLYFYGMLDGLLDTMCTVHPPFKREQNRWLLTIDTKEIADLVMFCCYKLDKPYFCKVQHTDAGVEYYTINCGFHPVTRIPLTTAEEERMLSELTDPYKLIDNHTLWVSSLERNETLLKYIPTDLVALRQRVTAPNIVWVPIGERQSYGKQRVYDFLVDTTKTFIINNGVVVYDTVNVSGILTKEANEEVLAHLDSVDKYILPNGELTSAITDLVKLTLYNLSRDPS